MVGVEIADTDGPQLPLPVRLRQGAVGTVAVAERLVQQHQVDVLCLEFLQTLVNRSLCPFVAVVRNPYFRHEEDVLAPDAALLPGTPHALLIAVSLCRVYHPIAHL